MAKKMVDVTLSVKFRYEVETEHYPSFEHMDFSDESNSAKHSAISAKHSAISAKHYAMFDFSTDTGADQAGVFELLTDMAALYDENYAIAVEEAEYV